MYKALLLLIITCFGMLTQAQNETYVEVKNSKEVEAKILLASTTTKSIACNFKQVKELEYLSTAIESSGKFWFKDGDKLRWEYTSPFNYIIAINNGVFTIKDDDKITVFDTKSNKAFKELNDVLMTTVDGTLMSSGKFSYTLSESKNSYLVKLLPKSPDMKEILSNIHLYFSKSDLTVYKVKMIETTQDYTIISFTQKVLNSDIDPSLFILNP